MKNQREIIDLYYRTIPTRSIAKTYNVTVYSIYNIWKKAGLIVKNRDRTNQIQKICGLWKVLGRVWLNNQTHEYSYDKSSIPVENLSPMTYYECECQGCKIVTKAIWQNNLNRGSTKSCVKCAYKIRDKKRLEAKNVLSQCSQNMR